MKEYRTLLVPHDFSDHAHQALQTAKDFAKLWSSDLHLVHILQTPAYAYAGYAPYVSGAVLPPPVDTEALRQKMAESLREVARRVGGTASEAQIHVVVGSNIADEICRLAETLDADLIVMGTHGRTGLAHVFLGSVAERTLRQAPCPVLSVPLSETDEAAANARGPEGEKSAAPDSHRRPGGQGSMETLHEAIERLEQRGFRSAFYAVDDGSLAIDDQVFAPESLVVEEVVRFEGVSDPGDESVLFALRSEDGAVLGTFNTTYGPNTSSKDAAALHRIELRPKMDRTR